MAKIFFYMLLIFVFVHSEGCWMDVEYPLGLVNNASHSIGYYLGIGDFDEPVFPDTTLPMTNRYYGTEIPSGATHVLYYSGISWDKIYQTLPEDTMCLFIFHTDTLKKYSWNQVRLGYKVLRRYDLSLDDLKKSRFRLTYP